jgi:dihydropteroate synthase
VTAELHCGAHRLKLDRPLVMGIVNCTPDSFSGDGLALDLERALAQGQAFIDAGADILDVGGESSRPGAAPVSEDEELRRVIPVVEALAVLGVPVSIDTVKPGVMRAALAAGASMINDINALREPGAMEAAAGSHAAVCLMHMQGSPGSMQDNPAYADVVAEVAAFLGERAEAARAAGIAEERIVVDPGFGFGKTAEHNLALLRDLDTLGVLGFPVLVGLSRKSVLGKLTGRPVTERVAASVAAALAAVVKGANIVRVHDVAATRDALAVWRAAMEFGY